MIRKQIGFTNEPQYEKVTAKELAKDIWREILLGDRFTTWAENYPDIYENLTDKERIEVIRQFDKLMDRMRKIID